MVQSERSSKGYLGDSDYLRDVEVGGDGVHALADEVGLVGLLPVHVHLVLLGVDGHGADAQLGARTEDANGDLAWKRGKKSI